MKTCVGLRTYQDKEKHIININVQYIRKCFRIKFYLSNAVSFFSHFMPQSMPKLNIQLCGKLFSNCFKYCYTILLSLKIEAVIALLVDATEFLSNRRLWNRELFQMGGLMMQEQSINSTKICFMLSLYSFDWFIIFLNLISDTKQNTFPFFISVLFIFFLAVNIKFDIFNVKLAACSTCAFVRILYDAYRLRINCMFSKM